MKLFNQEVLRVVLLDTRGFSVIEHVRTSVLTLCDHGHGEGSQDRLGFPLREELTQLLKRSAGQSLDGTEVADQG